MSSNNDEDMVNHPPHYNWHPKGIECIDVVEWMKSPNLANVIKYVWRADGNYKNDDMEDLKKAEWYIRREIKRREIKGTEQYKVSGEGVDERTE